jgi:hypothetical protein
MHKWGAIEMSSEKNTSLTQTRKHQKLKNNDPKQITTWKFQEIVMTFFMEHTMAYFDNAFVNNQRTSLEKYK